MPKYISSLLVDEFPDDPVSFFPGTLKVLGSGGFSRVLAAIDRNTKNNVAVKLYEFHFDQVHRESYERERDFYINMKPLNRSWMPQYYNSGENTREMFPWISIERLQTSLFEACVLRTPDSATMAQYALGALAALESLHADLYVHCDIKPANLMLRAHPSNESTTVVLVDFGSTLTIDPLTLTSEYERNINNGFTVDYASRRQLLGLPQGPADDLESLGYTLYQLYTQCYPLPWSADRIRNNGLRNLPLKRKNSRDASQEFDEAQALKSPADANAGANGTLPDTVPGTTVQAELSAELRIVSGHASPDSSADFLTEPLSGTSTYESNLRYVRTRSKLWGYMAMSGAIPSFLVEWVRYCQDLREGEKPDYKYLKSLLPPSTAGPLHLHTTAPPLTGGPNIAFDSAPAVLYYAPPPVLKKRKYEDMEYNPTAALNEE